MTDQVILTPGTNPNGGGFEWQMSLNGSKAQGAPYPPISVAHGNTGVITFTIQNAPGVTFASTPFLVPPDAKGIDVTSAQPTALTVTDHNLKKGDVPYVLMFNGAAKLDPIIENDGGGHIMFNDVLYAGLGGAAFGALLVLLVMPMFRRRGPVERKP
jgi:hypothetical protein